MIRPHPNLHLSLMVKTAPVLFEHFMKRTVTIVDLDQPLLVIGDEPVVVIGGAPPKHLPSCSLTRDEHKAAFEVR